MQRIRQPTYTTSWAANVFEGTVNIDPLVRYAAYWVSASAKNSAGFPSLSGNSLVRYLPLSVTLTNVDISGSNQLRITWTNTTEEYFDVQRRLSSGTPPYSWTTVKAALPANTLSWTDTTVTNNTGYCYQIRAYAAAGDPADSVSNEICQIAQAPPAPPALTLSTPTTTTV